MIPTVDETIIGILPAAHKIKDFEKLETYDIAQITECRDELTESDLEELITETNSSAVVDGSLIIEEHKHNFTVKSLNDILHLAEELSTKFSQLDPSKSCSTQFQKELEAALTPHIKIFKELETHKQF